MTFQLVKSLHAIYWKYIFLVIDWALEEIPVMVVSSMDATHHKNMPGVFNNSLCYLSAIFRR